MRRPLIPTFPRTVFLPEMLAFILGCALLAYVPPVLLTNVGEALAQEPESVSSAETAGDTATDAGDDDAVEVDQEIWDPLEGWNRGVFAVNDTLDVYLLEPIARGYDYVVPEVVQTGIGNFFENLGYPSYLVSDVVQLKFGQAAHHTGRFLVNTTAGLLGFIDVAKDLGLEAHKEDFGIALAYHGVPAGPYIVLPLFGPSNLRDGIGRLVDLFLDPVFYLAYTDVDDTTVTAITFGLAGVRIVDQRAGLLEAVESGKESSLDYYTFVQSSYYQYRRGVLNDGKEAASKEGSYAGSASSVEPRED